MDRIIIKVNKKYWGWEEWPELGEDKIEAWVMKKVERVEGVGKKVEWERKNYN